MSNFTLLFENPIFSDYWTASISFSLHSPQSPLSEMWWGYLIAWWNQCFYLHCLRSKLVFSLRSFSFLSFDFFSFKISCITNVGVRLYNTCKVYNYRYAIIKLCSLFHLINVSIFDLHTAFRWLISNLVKSYFFSFFKT